MARRYRVLVTWQQDTEFTCHMATRYRKVFTWQQDRILVTWQQDRKNLNWSNWSMYWSEMDDWKNCSKIIHSIQPAERVVKYIAPSIWLYWKYSLPDRKQERKKMGEWVSQKRPRFVVSFFQTGRHGHHWPPFLPPANHPSSQGLLSWKCSLEQFSIL